MTDAGDPGPGGPAGEGPAGDEARRMIEVVQGWAQRAMPAPPSGHGGPECEWCPLCQFASILRGEYPELTLRVAEAGSALAGAFRALMETTAATAAEADPRRDTGRRDDGSGEPSGRARPGRGSTPSPAPRVQRIRLGEPDPGTDDARSAEQWRARDEE